MLETNGTKSGVLEMFFGPMVVLQGRRGGRRRGRRRGGGHFIRDPITI